MTVEQRLLLVNADIRTMDPARPRVSALAMSRGVITGTGEAGELRAANPGAEVVDLGGRVVIPGFVDAHCHFELTTTHLSYAVPLHAPPHSSLQEICRTLADRVAATPGNGWIVGRANFGLHQFVAEQRPITRQDLDEAVPDRPVVVFSGMHVTTMNTAGLRAAGFLDGAVPPMGALLDLETGRGTELWASLPQPEFGVDAVAAAMTGLGTSMFTARGVTTINDIVQSPDGIRAYQQLRRAGSLPARIDLRYHSPRLLTSADLGATALETGFGDSWLRLGGIKLFIDGAGHDLAHETLVDLKWHQDDLDAEVAAAHQAGLQLMMHVQSAEAVDMALLALERALARHPRADHRHRLEHGGDLPVDPERLDRMAALGVVPVATPQFIYSYGDAQPEASQPPLRSLHERGFRVPGNSDSTGTQPEASNPFHSIWCALTRRTRLGRELAPEEKIDLDAAMRMFTADAAWACHLDDRGVLAPGKLADLTVLGANPWDVPVDSLPEVPVDEVWIDGEVRYDRHTTTGG
jgi:predicted amidohydrolase YtcJ